MNPTPGHRHCLAADMHLSDCQRLRPRGSSMRVVGLTAVVALMIVSTAAADGVKIGVNIGVPAPVVIAPAPPVVIAPAPPVVVAPPPVLVATPPQLVVVPGSTVYYAPGAS